MKTIFINTILFCLMYNFSFAQIQKGIVREINSDKKPLNNVAIKFNGSVPTTSDDKGNFRLAFAGKEAGELIFKEEIKKSGYELVNKKAFEILKLSSNDKLGVDIILAKKGIIELAKKKYYEISDKELLAGLEREKKALKQQLAAEKISENDYSEQLTALQEQYDWQWKLLDELANKFARVNFDDVSAIYKEALMLFKAGNVTEAITKMEKTNLISRIDTRLEERQRILNSGNIIAAQQAENEAGIREDIALIQLNADLYTLTYRIDEAEELYDQLLKLDSMDLEILDKAGDFYQANHKYQKALSVNHKITKHSKAEPYQIANAYGHIGELNTEIGELINALDAYDKSFKQYKRLSEKYPKSVFYTHNLGVSYEKLGSIHTDLGNLKKALGFFEKDFELMKELYERDTTNVNLKNGLAISYSRLGNTYADLGNLNLALDFFEKYNQLEKELYQRDTMNSHFKNGLAISYSKLGEMHTSLGNLNLALDFFEKHSQLEKELYQRYPTNINFKNGLAISYSELGGVHQYLGNLNKSLDFFKKCSQIEKELHKEYSLNIFFTENLAISYSRLGDTYVALGNLPKALNFFEKYNQLGKELYQKDTINIHFKNNLATSYQY
jgi:tetratricopeptide (TPR) repeat protein